MNTVGGFERGSLADSEAAAVRAMLELNLETAFWTSRAAARRLEEGSAIVHVAARAALVRGGGSTAYAVAKAGVVRLTQVLADELAERRVRVNAVLPSMMGANAVPPEQVASVIRVPLQRRGGRGERRGDPGLRMGLAPLAAVLDDGPGPALELPEELERLYGGPLRLPEDALYANFVQTLDGVVAIPSVERSNAIVAAGSESDRFVMGVLRASADAVMIGSGTLAGSPKALWRAGRSLSGGRGGLCGAASPARRSAASRGGGRHGLRGDRRERIRCSRAARSSSRRSSARGGSRTSRPRRPCSRSTTRGR